MEDHNQVFLAQIVAAENAHLVWLRTINTALLTRSPEIKIVTDGHECAFGKWYYAEGDDMAAACCADLQKGFVDLEQGHLDVHDYGNELIRLWNPQEPQPAIDYYTSKILPLADELLKRLAALNARGGQEIETIRAQSNNILRVQYLATVVFLLVGMIFLIPFSYQTARGIARSLNLGVKFAEELQHGNASQRLNMKRKDEIGELAGALDRAAAMIEGQARLVQTVANGDLTQNVVVASENDLCGNALVTMLDNLRDSISQLTQVSGNSIVYFHIDPRFFE